jgi:hypothetical protein
VSDPVDDYLERLDHLLTARALAPPPLAGEPEEAPPPSPAETPQTAAPPRTERGPAIPAAPSLVAEAFAAVLALEEGEPGARPVRLVAGAAEPRVTDALVESSSGWRQTPCAPRLPTSCRRSPSG